VLNEWRRRAASCALWRPELAAGTISQPPVPIWRAWSWQGAFWLGSRQRRQAARFTQCLAALCAPEQLGQERPTAAAAGAWQVEHLEGVIYDRKAGGAAGEPASWRARRRASWLAGWLAGQSAASGRPVEAYWSWQGGRWSGVGGETGDKGGQRAEKERATGQGRPLSSERGAPIDAHGRL